MEEFVYGMRAATSSEPTWTWIDDYDFLAQHDVTWAIPWILPVGENLGSQRINNDRAKAAGLRFRPVALTAMETLDWYHTLTDAERAAPPPAITPAHEAEVLAAWKAR
jgi:2'-hydroxyisoflavone reductase